MIHMALYASLSRFLQIVDIASCKKTNIHRMNTVLIHHQ